MDIKHLSNFNYKWEIRGLPTEENSHTTDLNKICIIPSMPYHAASTFNDIDLCNHQSELISVLSNLRNNQSESKIFDLESANPQYEFRTEIILHCRWHGCLALFSKLSIIIHVVQTKDIKMNLIYCTLVLFFFLHSLVHFYKGENRNRYY